MRDSFHTFGKVYDKKLQNGTNNFKKLHEYYKLFFTSFKLRQEIKEIYRISNTRMRLYTIVVTKNFIINIIIILNQNLYLTILTKIYKFTQKLDQF